MTRVHALPDEAATLALGAGLAASLPRSRRPACW